MVSEDELRFLWVDRKGENYWKSSRCNLFYEFVRVYLSLQGRGVGGFRGAKSKIIDIDEKLAWYLFKGEGLKGFSANRV